MDKTHLKEKKKKQRKICLNALSFTCKLNSVLTCLSGVLFIIKCQAEAVTLMITLLKNQLKLEAFYTNYSFCSDTNTSQRHHVQLNLYLRLAVYYHYNQLVRFSPICLFGCALF